MATVETRFGKVRTGTISPIIVVTRVTRRAAPSIVGGVYVPGEPTAEPVVGIVKRTGSIATAKATVTRERRKSGMALRSGGYLTVEAEAIEVSTGRVLA